MPDWERKIVDGVDSVVYSCGCRFPVVGEPVAPNPLPRIKVDQRNLPVCDATWDLLGKGLTKGVFQLESQLGRDWTRKMKPRSMEHMSGLVALLRPGCLNAKDDNGVSMTEHYVKRANNQEPVEDVHESIRHILGSTYNVMTYQEQAMQIVVAVAGFTPNEADMMRKAAGKKDTAGMAKVEKMFMEGVRKLKVIDEELGLKLMAWIKESQRYSFNRSHAMCYGYAGYDSAYLKAHFPVQFYTSWLAWAKEGADPLEEISDLVMDAKTFDVPVETPDVRLLRSDTWTDGVRVIFGLAEVSGIGNKQVEKLRASVTALAEATKDHFPDWTWAKVLWEACPVIQKNVAERLIIVGAFRHLGIARRRMLAELNAVQALSDGELAWCQDFVKKNGYPDIISVLRACAASKKDGGGCHSPKRIPVVQGIAQAIESPMSPLIDSPLWISNMEKQYLGIAISCTKIDGCDDAEVNCSCKEFEAGRADPYLALGVQIDQLREFQCKNGKSAGKNMAFLKVSDGSGALDNVTVFAEKYELFRNSLQVGNTVLLVGARDKKKGGFIVENVKLLA